MISLIIAYNEVPYAINLKTVCLTCVVLKTKTRVLVVTEMYILKGCMRVQSGL
jgi:hypothetical protein